MDATYFTAPTSHGPITLMSASSFGTQRMDATSIFLANKLVEKMNEKRDEMLKPLIEGRAADYPDYKSRAGYLKALEDVKFWIDEINADEEPIRGRHFARSP